MDLFRTVTLPIISKFGLEEGLDFRIEARGAPPQGGGRAVLFVPTVRRLKPLRMFEQNRIKRVRGLAYGTRIAASMCNRLVEGAKEVLGKFTQDVFIYCDHYKGAESGKSPGFGCALVAETIDGCLLGAERCAEGGGELPEDLGREAAIRLLAAVSGRGCLDGSNEATVLTFMALCPAEVSKIRIGGGDLHTDTRDTLRLLQSFFGVRFKIERDADDTILLACIGSGLENIHKLVR